jgi:hypothetical protein
MNLIDKKMAKTITGLVGAENIEKQVTQIWAKKNACLENLSNENKEELKKIELQNLKGLLYKGIESQELFKLLKASKNITSEQKEFAHFLYTNYPKHSIKAMGFD